jgi:4-amino-4-deoxy-L-arabinose transferase-like glycosyltransferase
VFCIVYLKGLEKTPNGFYVDEALPGYNAYSVLKTGKDEWGKVFPIVFRFFRLYNPPLFVYLNVISVYFFGLNVFAIRFTSVIFGFMSVFVFYALIRSSKLIKSKIILFWSVALFSITPWLVFYSRIGFEVVLAYFLFTFGIYLFWRYLDKGKGLIISYFFLSISMYSAYTQRILAPMFIIVTAIIYRHKIFNKKSLRGTLVALVIFFIIQVPYLSLITTPAFFPKGELLSFGGFEAQVDKAALYLPRFVANILVFTREVFSQYFTYISPRSLFFLPDSDLQRSMPELSSFYFWMVIPYVLGLYVMWKRRSNKYIRFIALLLLISAVPASLTHDPFATHRAMPILLPLSVIISLGINKVLMKVGVVAQFSVMLIMFFISLVILWRSYFVLFPNERTKYWQYGVDQLAGIIQKNSHLNFVIDQSRTQPNFTALAFYMEYPPEEYHKEIDQSVKDSYYLNVPSDDIYKFGNINARNIDWRIDSKEKKVLVGDEFTFSPEQVIEHKLKKLFEIRSPLGELVFVGYETNPNSKR